MTVQDDRFDGSRWAGWCSFRSDGAQFAGLRREAEALARQMDAYFPEAMVSGHEPLIATMRNDPKDRHVAAAAVKAGAQVVVTSNLKDFRDDFLCNCLISIPKRCASSFASKRPI